MYLYLKYVHQCTILYSSPVFLVIFICPLEGAVVLQLHSRNTWVSFLLHSSSLLSSSPLSLSLLSSPPSSSPAEFWCVRIWCVSRLWRSSRRRRSSTSSVRLTCPPPSLSLWPPLADLLRRSLWRCSRYEEEKHFSFFFILINRTFHLELVDFPFPTMQLGSFSE